MKLLTAVFFVVALTAPAFAADTNVGSVTVPVTQVTNPSASTQAIGSQSSIQVNNSNMTQSNVGNAGCQQPMVYGGLTQLNNNTGLFSGATPLYPSSNSSTGINQTGVALGISFPLHGRVAIACESAMQSNALIAQSQAVQSEIATEGGMVEKCMALRKSNPAFNPLALDPVLFPQLRKWCPSVINAGMGGAVVK